MRGGSFPGWGWVEGWLEWDQRKMGEEEDEPRTDVLCRVLPKVRSGKRCSWGVWVSFLLGWEG